MTVFVDDIKAAIGFLISTVDAAGELERASPMEKATVAASARALSSRINAAIGELDGSITETFAASGDFPPAIAKKLLNTIDDMEQLSTLLTMKGYVGRVQLMIEQVT